MSKAMDMADAIKTRLESLTLMEGIDVIVDRQKSITTIIAEKVAKARGACVQILLTRQRPIPGTQPMVTTPGYVVRLYTRPVIRDGDEDAVPADDLLEAMIPALDDWHPDPNAHDDDKCHCTDDAELLPDKNYLIYEFPVSCRVTLPVPQFNS